MDNRNPEDTGAEQLTANPKLLRVAQHYAAQAGGGKMPNRKCFRPEDLHWLFGHFYTVDILRGGADYRFGFCGPFWVAMYNLDPTGTLLSEMEACGRFKGLRGMYATSASTRIPYYCNGHLLWPNQKAVFHERVTVPFSNDSGEASMLLVAAQCDRSLSDVLLAKGFGEPNLILGANVPVSQLRPRCESPDPAQRSA
jgi:hypothetical protein